MASVVGDVSLQGIAELHNRLDGHERVVPVRTSFDFAAAVFGPRWVWSFAAMLKPLEVNTTAATSDNAVKATP
jgi:hypothetical protein